MSVEIHRHLNQARDLLVAYPDPRATVVPTEVVERIDRLERIIRGGCVMRSLESAFSAEATDKEFDLWFAKTDEATRDFGQLLEWIQPSGQDAFGGIFHRAVRHQLREFLGELSQQDSPLGAAVRGYSWKERELLPIGMERMVKSGNQLLVYMGTNHMAHVGLKGRQLVCLSDFHQNPLPSYLAFDALVFTPKPTNLVADVFPAGS